MLIHELLPLAGPATEVVEVGDGTLRDLLRVPDGVTHRRYAADDVKPDAGSIVVGFVGPKPEVHLDAEALAPAVRELPVGGRVVLLLGWPIDELPYHTVLSLLTDANCQVLQVVPLDKVSRHGAHYALIAGRVDRLAPPRAHLDDAPIELPGDEPGLRTLLRLTGEYAFESMAVRAARKRLVDLRDKSAAQAQRIKQLEAELSTTQRKAAETERKVRNDLARLRASTTYQVGNAMVEGARRPGKAIVTIPAGLVRVWRKRHDDPNAVDSGSTPNG